eukprot:sb/3469912/
MTVSRGRLRVRFLRNQLQKVDATLKIQRARFNILRRAKFKMLFSRYVKSDFLKLSPPWVAREFLFAAQFGQTKVLRTPKNMLFPVTSGLLPKSECKWGLSRANTTPRDKRGVTTSKNPTLFIYNFMWPALKSECLVSAELGLGVGFWLKWRINQIVGALRSFAAKRRVPPFLRIVITPSFQFQSKNDLQVFERSRRDLQKTWGSFCDLMQSKGVTVA